MTEVVSDADTLLVEVGVAVKVGEGLADVVTVSVRDTVADAEAVTVLDELGDPDAVYVPEGVEEYEGVNVALLEVDVVVLAVNVDDSVPDTD